MANFKDISGAFRHVNVNFFVFLKKEKNIDRGGKTEISLS